MIRKIWALSAAAVMWGLAMLSYKWLLRLVLPEGMEYQQMTVGAFSSYRMSFLLAAIGLGYVMGNLAWSHRRLSLWQLGASVVCLVAGFYSRHLHLLGMKGNNKHLMEGLEAYPALAKLKVTVEVSPMDAGLHHPLLWALILGILLTFYAHFTGVKSKNKSLSEGAK